MPLLRPQYDQEQGDRGGKRSGKAQGIQQSRYLSVRKQSQHLYYGQRDQRSLQPPFPAFRQFQTLRRLQAPLLLCFFLRIFLRLRFLLRLRMRMRLLRPGGLLSQGVFHGKHSSRQSPGGEKVINMAPALRAAAPAGKSKIFRKSIKIVCIYSVDIPVCRRTIIQKLTLQLKGGNINEFRRKTCTDTG